MRAHLIYPNTLDGHCAAAVARLFCERNGQALECYPVPLTPDGQQASFYQRIVDRCVPTLKQPKLIPDKHNPEDEHIYLLGVSVTADVLNELNDWAEWFTYCNHHDPYPDYNLLTCAVKVDDGMSTCESLARELFPGDPLPVAVQLIGRFTIGREIADEDKRALCFASTLFIEEILPFAYALRSLETDPGHGAGWEEWEKLFDGITSSQVRKRINEGKAIIRYQTASEANRAK